MAQKNIKIGEKELKYNLPSNSNIHKFVIQVYIERSFENWPKLSYYFVTRDMEKWSVVANDDDSVIMTIYGTTENGEVLNKDFYKKQIKGEVDKLSSRPYQSKGSLHTFNCEVKEMVDSPNDSYPVFILKAAKESNSHTNFYVQILKHRNTGNTENTEFIKLSISENNEIKDTTIKLQSRRTYDYKLYKINKIDEQYVVTGVPKVTVIYFVTINNFKTCYCQTDVEKLKEKAISHINERDVYRVIYLYRNKPSSHSTIIESKLTGIMKKYLKDNNGDQYSSINKNICGLHFSATPATESGDLPLYSFFGDYRIMIFPEYLVEGCNLYFADFYCMFSEKHWVTLVLTKHESEEDMFCQDRLVKLDIESNPFFYKSGNEYKVTSLDVEILYTEDINLQEMRLKPGFIEENKIETRGNGQSSPDGMPKNHCCTTCNLPRN